MAKAKTRANSSTEILGWQVHETEGKIIALYLSENEGSRFWLQVLTDPLTRGMSDILIACIVETERLSEDQSLALHCSSNPKSSKIHRIERSKSLYGGLKGKFRKWPTKSWCALNWIFWKGDAQRNVRL